MNRRAIVQNIIPVAIGMGIAVAALSLLLRAWYEVYSGELHGDALIFQTIGRGMLKGLKPYTDLFETKPPGIFLLHALSWKIFGSQFLVKLTQAAVLLGIPLLVLLPVLRLIEGNPASVRRVLSLLTLLFALLLGLYTAAMAGLGLAESYGAFFAVLFLALLVGRDCVSFKRGVILGVVLLSSVGLKEPFLLSILAGVILLHEGGGQSIIRFTSTAFVLPCVVAVLIGSVALFALGLVEPFFSVYLPYMLGVHVGQHPEPLAFRLFEVWRTFVNLGSFSWYFAVAITVLWILSCIAGIRKQGRMFGVRWVIASLLTFGAIAIGGDFYGHHFVFAVPVYAALWWVALRHNAFSLHSVLPVVVASLLLLTAFSTARFSYADQLRTWQEQEQVLRSAARTLDTVMERCGYEKYFQLMERGMGPYAYADAVPFGPVFIHYARFAGVPSYFTDESLKGLFETPGILISSLDDFQMTGDARKYIEQQFSENPPPCAGSDFIQPEPYFFLFRKEGGR